MKLRNLYLSGALLGLLTHGLMAQSLKLGFVEANRVLSGVEEGKSEIERIEKFMNEKQAEFNKRQEELAKMTEEFNAQQAKLNPEVRSEREKAIQERDRELKRYGEDTQLEINRRRDLLLNTLGQRIQALIEEYAKENNFSVIFVRDQSQAYVAPVLDVTEEVIRKFNAKYPLPAAAKPAEKKPGEK